MWPGCTMCGRAVYCAVGGELSLTIQKRYISGILSGDAVVLISGNRFYSAVAANNAAVTADNAAAKICFHIGHFIYRSPLLGQWYAVALQRLPLLAERLPLPQEAVLYISVAL